jgi:hypothetical protein
MRPRFKLAIAERAASSTASLSRWTRQVGVTGDARVNDTPTRTAIDLSSPVALADSVGDGRAKLVAVRPPPSYVTKV